VRERLGERLGADDVVFAAGSCVEGRANHLSDVDLFVLADVLPTDLDVPQRGIAVVFAGEVRWDVEFHSRAATTALVDRLAGLDMAAPGGFEAQNLGQAELLLLYSLLTGQALQREDELDALRERVEPRRFGDVLARRSVEIAEGGWEDVEGTFAGGEWRTALLRSQEVLDAATDAYLAWAGQLNPRAKWRLRKLDDAVAASPAFGAIRDDYWRLYASDGTTPEAATRLIHERLAFANRVVFHLQVAWHHA
jgi:hypothetical protein